MQSLDDVMNVVEAFLYHGRRLRMRNGARMLTVEVSLLLHFDELLSPQEKQRRKEFVLVEKPRMEAQVAKQLTLEDVATCSSAEVVVKEEELTRARPLSISPKGESFRGSKSPLVES